jgi:hypothetical protein
MTVTKEDDTALSRAQNRLLRRIYNGRCEPIVADGRPFLTFRDAGRYLRSLPPEARDAAYAEMKEQAKAASATLCQGSSHPRRKQDPRDHGHDEWQGC